MHTAIVNILRVSIALQGIGVALERLGFGGMWEDESPVFGLLLYDWKWSQATAQRVDDVGAWLYFVCGLALVVIPVCGVLARKLFGRGDALVPIVAWQLPLCIAVAVWQTVLTTVASYQGGSFMSDWIITIGSSQISLPWTLVSDASRIALPVALAVLTPFRGTNIGTRRTTTAIWILRIAACMTFVGHGIKTYFYCPAFIDYLFAAAEWISWDVSQATVEKVLRTIGVLDLVLAVLVMTTRWRAVAFYMAGWALIAALARVVQAGGDAHFEVLVRAGNYCVPIAVAVYWQLSRPNHARHTNHSPEPIHDASPPAR